MYKQVNMILIFLGFDRFPILYQDGIFYLTWKILVGCLILACFFDLPGYIIFGPPLYVNFV